ncbi:MAG: glycosyltransferase family 2 protein [Acidimicrobiales bacterium]
MSHPARPRVDVGVVCWNTRDLTVSALRKLLDTEQGCDLRLLVRDNASGDGSAAAIAEVVPEAELEAGGENLGFAAAMNRLVARSDAPWFLALNPDAWPEPGAVRALVAAGDAMPRAAAVAPRLRRPDGAAEPSTFPFPSWRVAMRGALGTLGRLDAGEGRARRVDWAVGAALLMRRAALDEIGGFDERYFMYVEDLDWCWRARRAGWEVWYEPAAVVRHVGNASGILGYGDRRAAVEEANARRFYRSTHGPVATAVWRGLSMAGALRLHLSGRLRRDPDMAAHWRRRLEAQVAPDRRPDRQPDVSNDRRSDRQPDQRLPERPTREPT